MSKLVKVAESSLSPEAAELWEITNQAEEEIEKLGRAAMPMVLVAGAALHLAKQNVEHGKWEQLVAARSGLSLRLIRQRMQTVDNALTRLAFEPESRAYETIVFSSKLAKRHDRAVLESDYAKELSARLNDALAGKNTHQIHLELGIRKAKEIRHASLPATTGNPHDSVSLVLMRLRDVAVDLQRLDHDLIDDKDHAAATQYCREMLAWIGED